MPNIDAEAAGILIESGCDPLTAVAGSIIDEPRRPRTGRRVPRRSRLIFWLAVIAGVIAAATLRALW